MNSNLTWSLREKLSRIKYWAQQPDQNRQEKVFALGFNKCGTTSLNDFFARSGVDTLHWESGRIAKEIVKNFSKGHEPLGHFRNYSGFTDISCLSKTRVIEPIDVYKYLYAWYPKAKFILNTRPLDKWLKSRWDHDGGKYRKMYKCALGCKSNKDLELYWIFIWERAHNEITAFFHDSDSFLEFNIESDNVTNLRFFLRDTLHRHSFSFRHLNKG